jgi:hypothetical protein
LAISRDNFSDNNSKTNIVSDPDSCAGQLDYGDALRVQAATMILSCEGRAGEHKLVFGRLTEGEKMEIYRAD